MFLFKRKNRDTFLGYITGNFPDPLSAKEEETYLERMKKGDFDARNILIERNLRLVAHIVKKYSGAGENDDLISIGTIGLIKGISTFDTKKKIRLATYVSKCIENEILMGLRREKKFLNQVSLQDPIGFDGEGNEVCLMDVLESDTEDFCEEIDRNNLVKRIHNKIKEKLEDREKCVIQMRYGLSNGEIMTQKEVAKKLGISRSYVSRIEKKAINKLRQ